MYSYKWKSFWICFAGFSWAYHPSCLWAHTDKTIKLWKVAERDKRPEGYNLKDETGLTLDPSNITSLRVPFFQPMELMVEASPKRVFANAHTYHINSISVNSDQETYLSADDLRINLWNLEITNQSFSILAYCCLCVVFFIVWFLCCFGIVYMTKLWIYHNQSYSAACKKD